MASTVDAKLLKQTKFPPEFNQKVDMKKVNVEVMKKYEKPAETRCVAKHDPLQVDCRQDFRNPGQRRRRGHRALLQFA